MLTTQVFEDHEAMSQEAAARLCKRFQDHPDALVCLATGATPLLTYEILVERLLGGDPRCFERLRAIKLDEWGGLGRDDPASCEHYLRRSVVDPLDLDARYVGFDGRAADPEQECRRIGTWLEQNGPIDVCVLGLGVNGHLGFNEPANALRPHAHVATLSESSLGHSMLSGTTARPSHGLTLGMADLLHAREILLLVSGPAKHDVLRRLGSGPIDTLFPASFLQLHARVTVLCDVSAAGD